MVAETFTPPNRVFGLLTAIKTQVSSAARCRHLMRWFKDTSLMNPSWTIWPWMGFPWDFAGRGSKCEIKNESRKKTLNLWMATSTSGVTRLRSNFNLTSLRSMGSRVSYSPSPERPSSWSIAKLEFRHIGSLTRLSRFTRTHFMSLSSWSWYGLDEYFKPISIFRDTPQPRNDRFHPIFGARFRQVHNWVDVFLIALVR
jgi:hypothetical protein